MKSAFLIALAAAAVAAPASALTIPDKVGDIRPGDGNFLDITSFSVELDGSDFIIRATTNGEIGGTLSSYVIGVDRGGGEARPHPFAGIGRPNIVFDQAFSVRSNGDVFVGANKMFTFTIQDDTQAHTGSFFGRLSGLQSQGFTLEQFRFSIWSQSRTPAGAVTNVDFAPENRTIAAIPEPSTWAMMLLGFGAAGSLMRRARRRLGLVAA